MALVGNFSFSLSDVPHISKNTIAVASSSARAFMWELIIGEIQEAFIIF